MQEMSDRQPIKRTYDLIKLKEVLRITCLSRSHLYALIQKNKFPAPVKLSERSSAWLKHEVEFWIAKRIEARDMKINRLAASKH